MSTLDATIAATNRYLRAAQGQGLGVCVQAASTLTGEAMRRACIVAAYSQVGWLLRTVDAASASPATPQVAKAKAPLHHNGAKH